MDFKFMWYANAMVINTIMPLKKRYEDRHNVDIIKKDIKDKYMKYRVSVSGDIFHYNYTFFSNVCIQGTLEIHDVKCGISHLYGVERINDSIRFYHDPLNYNEMTNYKDGAILDIQVTKARKSYISTLQFKGYNDTSWETVSTPTAVTDEQRSNFDYSLDNELFTVTGAIDYKTMTCHDVVNFQNRNGQLVVFAEAKVQIATTHTHERGYMSGLIKPVNSDFNQYIEYDKTGDRTFAIREYLINNDGHSILKRQYTLINRPNRIIEIEETKTQYQVTNIKNDVTFTRK